MGRSTIVRAGSKIPAMKRLVAAALWLYAAWFAGSFVAVMLNVPDLLGPALGISAGLIVGIDPRHVIWVRPASKLGTARTTSTAASAA